MRKNAKKRSNNAGIQSDQKNGNASHAPSSPGSASAPKLLTTDAYSLTVPSVL